MPNLQNNPPFIGFAFSTFAPQIRINQLCYYLLSSTFSIFSFSTCSEHPFTDLSPGKTVKECSNLIKIFTRSRRFVQSLFLFKKLLRLSKPGHLVYPSLLMSCAYLSHQSFGLSIHGYLIKCGFESWVGVGNSLASLYLKFGNAQDAYRVFEGMPIKNSDVFNSLICRFGSDGFYGEVVVAFDRMLELHIFPYLDTVCHAIRACGELGSMGKALLVHDFVTRNGLNAHILIANSLISMYIMVGRLDLGHGVFDNMHDRDIVSWNSLIAGYARNGNWAEVFNLFLSMRKAEILAPNQVTFLGLLLACGQARCLDLGESIHGHLICSGLLYDFRLGTAIVDMYAKCNRVEYAQAVFDEDLLEKTLVSWNTLIAGYSQNGFDHEAVMLFKQMIVESGTNPDSITFANVIPAYSSQANRGRIQSIHAFIIKQGIDMDGDVVLATAMLDAYGKCSDIDSAESLFTSIHRHNIATWNAMIAAYNLCHPADQGVLLFLEMLESNVEPDAITMVMLFQSCGELGLPRQGSMLHGYCLSKGLSSHLAVENAIIDMYMRCGCLTSSKLLFSLMPLKNIVTWNTMLFGYVKNGCPAMAFKIFSKMRSENQYKPDSVTMISIIQAYAAVSTGHGGEIAHAYTLKLGLDCDTLVINSLIDAYAKNGLIDCARVLFTQMGGLKDQSSWNVMIAGYGVNGQGTEACHLLSKMEEDGYKPDPITFTALLSSCSHSGLIEEGCNYFHMMVRKYKIRPGLEQWTCIIDMLGRAGRLEEAYQLISNRLYLNSGDGCSSHFAAVWGAFLSACRVNMNVELGALAGKKLSKLAPDNCGYHMLLSNLYASSKRWNEAEKVTRVFEGGRLMKKPGLSILKL